MDIMEMSKLPGLLKQLVEKVPQEIEAAVKTGLAESESRFETKLETAVEAVLAKVFGGSFDLSAVESAISKWGTSATKDETDDGTATKSKPDAAKAGVDAAEQAKATGSDPVLAAAKAAHDAARSNGDDGFSAAQTAALAQDADDVTAASVAHDVVAAAALT